MLVLYNTPKTRNNTFKTFPHKKHNFHHKFFSDVIIITIITSQLLCFEVAVIIIGLIIATRKVLAEVFQIFSDNNHHQCYEQ